MEIFDFLKQKNVYVFLQLILGIWLGLIIGISFIEAPLKFQASGITQKVALGVGNLVFNTLNKVEIFFSIIVMVIMALSFNNYNPVVKIILIVLLSIIASQTIILFPVLNERIEMIQNDQLPTESKAHVMYVVFEIAKVILLLAASYKIYFYARN